MVKAKKRRSGCAASIIIAVIVVAAIYFLLPRIKGKPADSPAGASVPTADGAIAAPASGWYNFLTEKEREVYAKIYGALYHGKDSLTIGYNRYNGDEDIIEKCTEMCIYDHPEFIKYSGSIEYAYTYDSRSGDGDVEIRFGKNSYDDAAEKKFSDVLSSLVAGAEKLPTDFERALFVHDEIVKNTVYDSDSSPEKGSDSFVDAHSPYGCLVKGAAVCDGYAKAFLAAMERLGIDCLYVSGKAKGTSHAWNCVKLEGEWYVVDVTWDDPERDEKYADALRHDYFCITTEETAGRKANERFSPLPLCTATKYNYHTYYGLVLDEYTREGAAALFDSGATSIKFPSLTELVFAEQDLFKDRGCYTIDAFTGRTFTYSAENMIINVYFDD